MGRLEEFISQSFVIVLLLPILSLLYLKYLWPSEALKRSPASDIAVIKSRMGGEGHRVVDIVRDGGQVAYEGRGNIARVFRIYRVDVQYPDRSRVTRIVGVACTLIGAPYLVTYENGVRKGLWTHHQASLP